MLQKYVQKALKFVTILSELFFCLQKIAKGKWDN